MLRIGFLPSDFNPMVLLLGEAEDFRVLAGVLRQFALHPAPVRLEALACAAPGTTALTLSPAAGPCGVVHDDVAIAWRLDPDHARRFAAHLDGLTDPALLAGSELLECGIADEIPVKASRGEYTEDFLASRDIA